jgi:signal transduction histidine kinase/DNA-binding response OmpR family regulator
MHAEPPDAPLNTDQDRGDLVAELTEARQQQAAVSEVLAVMGRSRFDLQSVFETVINNATKLCRADAGQIYMLEEGVYRPAVLVGGSREYRELLAGKPIDVGPGTLVGRVAARGETVHIPDALADREYSWQEAQEAGRQRTMLGVPVLSGDRVIGVISLIRTEVSPFSERRITLVETFARQGAIAIRNAYLVRELQARGDELTHSVEELTALREVGRAVGSSLDLDNVLSTIVTHAVDLSETDGGTIFEYDEEAREFRLRTATGTSSELIERLHATQISLDGTLLGEAAKTGVPQAVDDLRSHPSDPHLAELLRAGWLSLLAVPLLADNRIIGALVVRRTRPGGFSEKTARLLDAFANQSAVAIQNARLYSALETKSRELEVASRHKSDFLAGMSHELRTPLNAVIGFSDVLLERMFGELTPKQEEYLIDIASSGRHLLELLNEILDLSKIEAGRMELQLEETQLNEALRDALAMVSERAARKDLTLEATLEPDLPAVLADRTKLKQVILNLLTNAIKFTPTGGTIEVGTAIVDGMVELSVTDTGIGVAEEDRGRIFDAFQQGGRDGRPSPEEGTGLGLTLSKRIVELHRGRIWLEAPADRGSRFTFAIPIHAELADGPEKAPTEPQAASRLGTVLVVEDDESSADLLRLYLESEGFDVAVARDGDEGLELVRRLRPEAVILDLVLPTIDGWDVLGELKGDQSTASVPVIIVSMLDERGKGIALGASEYLVKPVRRHELRSALLRCLPRDLSSGKVLVIDDDPLVLELIGSVLAGEGHEVITAAGGEEGIEKALVDPPAVVLLDLLMPEVDGFAVVERLRAEPATARVPIVILTAKQLSVEDKQRLSGQISYLAEKGDFDRGALIELVRSLTAPAEVRPSWATS